MKHVTILGATGSIGTQTLEVIRHLPDEFRVVGLSAGNNMPLLARQIEAFRPQAVAVRSEEKASELRMLLDDPPEIWTGSEGLTALACQPHSDTVVVGLVGFAGLLPTLEALKAGKTVLTANKETFVTAGHLVRPYLKQVIPLDSEHSAIFQCLQGCRNPEAEVRRIYLTASGGPFRTTPLETLRHVTLEQALQHPNWTMGEKVTIDSATMMNKGLEIIEAHHLFQLSLEKIEVVIHPQSIVHSAVAFADGSIIAQLGQPDMRTPIQYGLTYPHRLAAPCEELHLDLTTLGTLDFAPADLERFPCLKLARWAGETGGTLPVVLNAADEMAVAAFLKGHIPFMAIPSSIEQLMHQHMPQWQATPDLERITQVDAWTRQAFEAQLSAQAVS